MAFVDVVKFEGAPDDWFVWRHPSDQIKLGSQLIVHEGQQALFAKGGEVLDRFGAGTFTLTTGNLPIIDKAINLAFAGKTPFAAEVWFFSTTAKRDLTWGTIAPIPLMDVKLGMPVSVRAFGRWGARISEPPVFHKRIVGAKSLFTSDQVYEYFVGQITQSISRTLGNAIAKEAISVLEIAANLDVLSDLAASEIRTEFEGFGMELVNFDIQSVNIPRDELENVQNIFTKSVEARELSRTQIGGAYTAIKSFEVMNNAAQNPSDGSMGAMLGAGIGFGAGFPLGESMSKKLEVDTQERNVGEGAMKFEDRLRALKQLLDGGLISQDEFDSKRKAILDQL